MKPNGKQQIKPLLKISTPHGIAIKLTRMSALAVLAASKTLLTLWSIWALLSHWHEQIPMVGALLRLLLQLSSSKELNKKSWVTRIRGSVLGSQMEAIVSEQNGKVNHKNHLTKNVQRKKCLFWKSSHPPVPQQSLFSTHPPSLFSFTSSFARASGHMLWSKFRYVFLLRVDK